MFKKLLEPGNHTGNTNTALLILREGAGLMMLTHGWAKFQNLLAGEMGFADPIGIGAEASLVLTVLAEFACSILVILGLGTRLAAIPLIITMAVAWFIVHSGDPFGTKEKAALYLLCYLVIFITGAGKYSFDQLLFGKCNCKK